jgi:hypothetical protein
MWRERAALRWANSFPPSGGRCCSGRHDDGRTGSKESGGGSGGRLGGADGRGDDGRHDSSEKCRKGGERERVMGGREEAKGPRAERDAAASAGADEMGLARELRKGGPAIEKRRRQRRRRVGPDDGHSSNISLDDDQRAFLLSVPERATPTRVADFSEGLTRGLTATSRTPSRSHSSPRSCARA